MYTSRIRSGPGALGALPALLVTGILQMVKSEFTQAQIRSRLATEYKEMQRLSEAQLTELAVLLGRETDVPEWDWFNLLRSARDMGLFRNGAQGNGQPAPGPAANTATWIAIGAAAVLAVLIVTK